MFLPTRHSRLLKRLLFLLIPYSLLRIGFYFYHLNIYKQFTQEETFESFLLGIRFDIAAICLLNIPIILLALVPTANKTFDKVERVLFILLNTCGFIVAIDDYELFLFMGKRLSFDFFVITDDILQQLPQIILHYWYLPLVAVLFGVGFYFFDRRTFKLKEEKFPWGGQSLSSVLILGLCFIGIRGGLQYKSINVQSAFTQGKNELGHLVLNSPYHFLRTLKNKPINKIAFFKTDDEAINIIINARDLRNGRTVGEKRNVMLIIMESFSLEYMEKGYMPFLSELKSKAVFFPFHLANGRKSIEALPSLLCGMPSLLDEPLSKSIYQGNKFECMPKLLKNAGYANYFFHGGTRGTMGFESYSLANGFDRYFSKEDYPNQGDYDGTWGIFDGPYLQYLAKNMSKMPKPFLVGFFSLSSHQPYSVPEKLKGKFAKGTLEIHESIGYADSALRDFFETIKNEEWFKNTIFIITADHTSKLESKKFQNLIGQFRVPLIIYTPGSDLEIQTEKVTQHADIPKTILDLVGIKVDSMPATAVSLLSSDKGYALNYADGHDYLLISKDETTDLAKDGSQKRFTYDWETGELWPGGESKDPLIKAYLQYYVNGLINNNLSLYR